MTILFDVTTNVDIFLNDRTNNLIPSCINRIDASDCELSENERAVDRKFRAGASFVCFSIPLLVGYTEKSCEIAGCDDRCMSLFWYSSTIYNTISL